MKQILQDIRKGDTCLMDVPAPLVGSNDVLIANARSLLSAGTEKMVLDLSKKSLLGKARERPDHVRRVIEKVRQEGLFETMRQVREKLDDPMTMGYSSAGVVLACGTNIQHLKPGDRVASNGPHAEIVAVPKHLVASVPDSVPLNHAAFTVLGSIALQGCRLAEVSLGEKVLVIGLGLIGQLAVAILNAAGCIVFGTDPDAEKCKLAEQMGATVARPGLAASTIEDLTGGVGVDAVLITASTKSNGPIELAAGAVRKRGRVVLVGVVGLELDRRPFYFKEAEFVVSCSYGPGRYDADYEQRGHDYPIAHVRWTEQRNMQAVLDLMASGKLDLSPLISHRFPIEQAEQAYRMIEEGSEPYLGIVLEYEQSQVLGVRCQVSGESEVRGDRLEVKGESEVIGDRGQVLEEGQDAKSPVARKIRLRDGQAGSDKIGVGVLGAGNFAKMVLIPKVVADAHVRPVVLCSAKGVSASHVGKKNHFEEVSTDEDDVLSHTDVDVVFSITQHQLHADHVVRAIQSGKHCFVEKPLCLTVDELRDIEQARAAAGPACPMTMVGFNRRFAPAAKALKDTLQGIEVPLTVSYRFNAGAIDADHWTQHLQEGGGRIIGEACHAIDFVTWLTGSLPTRVFAESIGGPSAPDVTDDQCFITLRHTNGSISNIAYLAGGDRSCPKERVEVIAGGRVAILDDFRRVTSYRGGRKSVSQFKTDKGHAAEVTKMLAAAREGLPAPIPWNEIRTATLASILAVQSMREGMPLEIPTASE